MTSGEALALEGQGRLLPALTDEIARVTFGEADFTLAVGSETRVAAYRDIATIAVQQGSTLVVVGEGPGAEPLLLSGFGQAQGQLIRELRERRFRQELDDALIQAPTEPIELVEYLVGGERGVAQIAYHPWGVVLAPLDERLPWIGLRRGAIGAVGVDEMNGHVTVTSSGASARASRVELPGLGQRARFHGDHLSALRRAAQEDTGRFVARLVPDAEYTVRLEATRALVDGRPATPADLPSAWDDIEAGVLVEPTFAASYRALVVRAGLLADARALAIAAAEPGGDEAKSWFFVPLPGNLVALELVSEGAHATYCFRVQSRAEYSGQPPSPDDLRDAIDDVSEALVDSRFLREPIALPDDQLRQTQYRHYRLALRALPSLAAARRRFVGRIVHRDAASWAAALDDVSAWNVSTRDDAAVWPRRVVQEAMISEAGAADAPAADAPAAEQDPSSGGS